MRLSSKKIKPTVQKEILDVLYQVIADFRRKDEVEILAKEFLGLPLSLTLAKKIAVLKWLKGGKDYQQIHKDLEVSTATIASIQKEIETNPALKLIMEKIETDEWAEKWSQKISSVFKRK